MTGRRGGLVAAAAAGPAWVGPAATGLVGLGACALLALRDPNVAGAYGWCPFRLATGLDCPGCGTLRALHALTGGDLVRALDHNLLAVLLLPVLLLTWVRWLRGSLRGVRALPRATAAFGYTVAAVTACFMVLRNLPWEAVAWLGSGAA